MNVLEIIIYVTKCSGCVLAAFVVHLHIECFVLCVICFYYSIHKLPDVTKWIQLCITYKCYSSSLLTLVFIEWVYVKHKFKHTLTSTFWV